MHDMIGDRRLPGASDRADALQRGKSGATALNRLLAALALVAFLAVSLGLELTERAAQPHDPTAPTGLSDASPSAG